MPPEFKPLPEKYFSLAAQSCDSVLLHTSKCSRDNHRSLLFLNPSRTIAAWQQDDIPVLLDAVEHAVKSGNFVAGYFSYEFGEIFEAARSSSPNPAAKPLAWFGIYPEPYVFNHRTGGFEGESPAIPDTSDDYEFAISNLRLGISETNYRSKIDSIHEYIRAGETYQINLTDAFTFEFAGSPAALFASLNAAQPVAYAALIRHDDRFVLSLSPELFFGVEDRTIVTRPMKGTAPRGRTTKEDAHIAASLQSDAKNQAENVMIVDLLRNDIGRICEYGSVRVDELFSIEKYATLFQMTSTVSGILRPEIDFRDILRATFPSGSITGAPKIRSMEIIRELERHTRGVYTGAIGFVAPGGNSVFNVAIRTIVLEHGRGTMGVGGGITIDSNAQDEFRECQLKAKFLTDTPPPFEIFESLLWNGQFPYLSAHLDRISDSALYFDFPFARREAERLLFACADSLAAKQSFKVRLSIDRHGSMSISSSELRDATGTGLVTLSAQRTSSSNRFLYHKTTNRRLYDESYDRAVPEGFDDILFLNERGELTEGAISNVFLQFGDRLHTPPVSCGLLPGVFRQHLLAADPRTSERVLTLDDLRRADAVFICNAVRGLRQVRVRTRPLSRS